MYLFTAGRFCEWKPKTLGTSAEFDTFDDYFDTLTLTCESHGHAGELTWTPDESTPDIVYYQVTVKYF